VEGLSLEEAFLDVTGLERISGSPTEIAARLRLDVRTRVGLPITVGVARTKALAKVASGVAKPDGLLVLAPDRELEFLHGLPIERLWGIGPSTARKLHARGIATVGELARRTEAELVSMLGRASGRHLHSLAHNRDPRRVRTGRRRRSVGSQSAFGRASLTSDALDAVILSLVDRVTRRMRASGWVGRTVILRLRFRDFTRATRSRTLLEATASTRVILAIARAILAAAMPMIERRGLTLLGLTVTGLGHVGAGVQLALPLEEADSGAVDIAMDEIRERFGPTALTRGTLLGKAPHSITDP
jgi:DNA polymerase IV